MIPLATPPWTKVGKKIESAVRAALYDFNLLEGAEKVSVALSGGKDSLTLLFLLKAILGRGFPHLELHALHINGAFSCGAGIKVDGLKDLCDRLEVYFHTANTSQTLEDLECYSCSRERRRLLFELARKAGATTIAFGHHRDDHVGTVLMNLLHKAEFAGNLPKVPMRNFGVTIIRPLIYVKEEDIRTFAEQNHFIRIVCRCPYGGQSMRKKVDSLLTEIVALYPNARENIAKAALLFGSDKALHP